MMEKQRIVFLDYLRVAATLMVIMVHACQYFAYPVYIPGGPGGSAPDESSRLWGLWIDSALRASVPLFVMTSAYLLVPLRCSTGDFFKRRFVRVFIPFFIWSLLYPVLPMLWGEFDGQRAQELMQQWFTNFPVNAEHLWFIYTLIGIYLLMPILSPWLQKVGRREEEVYLGLWFLSTFWLYAKEWLDVEYLYGEAVWNNFHMLYYVAGYIGYVMLAHYIRKYLDWSMKKTLMVCIPLFIIGLVPTAYAFYDISQATTDFYLMELPWRFCTPNCALMTFALFMLFKKIRVKNEQLNRGVADVSRLSYGMYLVHLFLLGVFYRLLAPYISHAGVMIVVHSVLTLAVAYIIIKLLSYLPGSKYVTG